MWHLLLVVLTLSLASGRKQVSSPSNDDPRELLKECEPWGKLEILVKNRNGSFTLMNTLPNDLFCEVHSQMCAEVDGELIPQIDNYVNNSLTTVGLYGLDSLRTTQFARLIVFKTKNNHSDDFESHAYHGCEGTVHEDDIPPNGVKWFALIERGLCYFREKLTNAVHTHGADGFIVYNDDDSKNILIMNLTTPGLTTMMINNSIGFNILILEDLLNSLWKQFPNSTLPYTNEIYTNISFDHCYKKDKQPPPLAVTIVTITFVVLMILALAWLVVYYFMKHRKANKEVIMQLKYQKAAKKALKKIGERMIEPTDPESNIEDQEDCTYCLEPLVIGEVIRQLPCRHKFHKDCVDDWLIHNRTCPNCHNNILVATGVTIRGINLKQMSEEAEENGTELTIITPDSTQMLLSDSQPMAGHEESATTDSPYWGSQVIPGSQLLTDGQNVFLYLPNDVELPTDTTIQIENPPPNLARSHQQLVASEQLAAEQQLAAEEQQQPLLTEKPAGDAAV